MDIKLDSKNVRSYLQAVDDLAGGRAFESFVFKNGLQFAAQDLPAKLPLGVRRGEKRQCFLNCYRAVSSCRDLIYCEGYASPPKWFPVHHAWLIDSSGKVFDLTWDDCGQCEYFGIPFNPQYVLETGLRVKAFCLIDNHEERWPLIRQNLPREVWLHPAFKDRDPFL